MISPISGLNPSGGLPSESVQFDFICRIVVAAPCRFMNDYKKILATAALYAAPISWKLGEEIAKNRGTAFFISIGDAAFAVTAEHVYRAYMRMKEKGSNVRWKIGGLSFDPEERLIALDDWLDIAIFRMSAKEVEKTRCRIFLYNKSSWPPNSPETGSSVVFAGFPTMRAEQKNQQNLCSGVYAMMCRVTAISERKISMQLDCGNIIDTSGLGFPLDCFEFRGLSGAPLIWVAESNNNFLFIPSGVVYTYNSGFRLMFAIRIDKILPDGHLCRLH